MTFFQANMQTGILVLLVILVAIVCVALFFTNKEVRNIKASIVKSRHDITAIQTLLNDVGLTASGGNFPESESLIDQKDCPQQSRFMGMPPGIPSNVMFSPEMIPQEFRPDLKSEGSDKSVTSPKVVENNTPKPLPSDTNSEPATLNFKNPSEQKKQDLIPPEDVEVVDTENKTQTNPPLKIQEKTEVKSQLNPVQEESSEEETDSEEESDSGEE